MCGIAGYFGNLDINSDILHNCIQLMKRRGPDADAIYQHSFSNQKVLVSLTLKLLLVIKVSSLRSKPFTLEI